MNTKQLTLGIKLGYGMGMLGECLAMNTFYIFFLFFMTNSVGMAPGTAGMVAMASAFWGAFTDLMAGARSDISRNPKGRRRPFIFRASIPLGITVFLMYTDWSFISREIKPYYFLAVCLFFWLFLSYTDIPYQSLGSEITEAYKERTSIRSIANIANYAGMILASSGTLLLVSAFSKSGSNKDIAAWSKVGMLFGFIILLAYWVSCLATKGRESGFVPPQKGEKQVKPGYIRTCVQILKLKPYRYIMLYTVFAYSGIILYTSMYIYYLYYIMKETDTQVAVLMFVYCIMVMVVSALLGWIKAEKKKVVYSLSVLLGMGLCMAYFTGLGKAGIYFVFFLFSLGVSAYFVQIYSMLYDVCDLDELISGNRREGVIVSLFYFLGKIIGGIGMAATGWLLSMVKYNPGLAKQTLGTQRGIALGTMLLPGIFILIGGFIMIKYPIDVKKLQEYRSIRQSEEQENL